MSYVIEDEVHEDNLNNPTHLGVVNCKHNQQGAMTAIAILESVAPSRLIV